MDYTIITNGRSYDLPKKTISVMNGLDEIMKIDHAPGLSLKQKYEKVHRFMKDLVGEENCKEMYGSDQLEEIDLSDLALSVKMVIDAYEKPLSDYEKEKNMEKLDNIPIEKIVSLTKAANTMASFPKK